MVLAILEQIYNSTYFPHGYIPHILVSLLALAITHALSQGRKTSRERDLHARTILLTGALPASRHPGDTITRGLGGGGGALGITLLQELAKRGASVIALTDRPVTDPHVELMIELVRDATGNENVWAETCDLSDVQSVKGFATRFLTGQAGDGSSSEMKGDDGKPMSAEEVEEMKRRKAETSGTPGGDASNPSSTSGAVPADQRLDAIIFTHEYSHLGSLLRPETQQKEREEDARTKRSLSSFALTALLLPLLLIAPVERDIRIINVVNPFYAAAAGSSSILTSDPSFPPLISSDTTSSRSQDIPSSPSKSSSPFLLEGVRALRAIILTRHLQRILDALPAPPQAPLAPSTSEKVEVVGRKYQKSNIVAVSVSPGVSREDTVRIALGHGWFGWFMYMTMQPLLRLFTKSPASSIQSVLHALFLPTPFKSLGLDEVSEDNQEDTTDKDAGKEKESVKERKPNTLKKPRTRAGGPVFREVLKPGALYAECAVVTLPSLLKRPAMSTPTTEDPETRKGGGAKSKGASKPSPEATTGKGEKSGEELDITIEDDGEYGGEELGRKVWEAFEGGLKEWECMSQPKTTNASVHT